MKTETKIRPKTEAEKLFAGLDKPSLHALSYALRHPDTWPKDFFWDYSDCDQCAMGLAHALWKNIPAANAKTGATIMAREFAIPFSAASSIFMGAEKDLHPKWATRTKPGLLWGEKTTVIEFEDITPEMVADQIDKYLATAE